MATAIVVRKYVPEQHQFIDRPWKRKSNDLVTSRKPCSISYDQSPQFSYLGSHRKPNYLTWILAGDYLRNLLITTRPFI